MELTLPGRTVPDAVVFFALMERRVHSGSAVRLKLPVPHPRWPCQSTMSSARDWIRYISAGGICVPALTLRKRADQGCAFAQIRLPIRIYQAGCIR